MCKADVSAYVFLYAKGKEAARREALQRGYAMESSIHV